MLLYSSPVRIVKAQSIEVRYLLHDRWMRYTIPKEVRFVSVELVALLQSAVWNKPS